MRKSRSSKDRRESDRIKLEEEAKLIRELLEIMRDPEASGQARVDAACKMLDLGHGRPK